MSDRDTSGDGFTGGVSGSPEEAAWRDLIARYETQADRGAGTAPWPDREDLPGPSAPPGADGPDGADVPDGGQAPAGEGSGSTGSGSTGSGGTGSGGTGTRDGTPDSSQGRPGSQTPAFGRTRIIRPATPRPQAPPPDSPSSGQVARAGDRADPWSAEGSTSGGPRPVGPGASSDLDEPDDPDDHYVPPPPPPLPHLDPVAKGAWAALFGGPAYLFVSTLIGQTAPSWAALLAVAAFIGGFAIVVLRHGGGPSRGDGPDNGAVL